MAETEEYFPRGGKKTTKVQFQKKTNFLGAVEKGEKKKKRPSKKSEADDGYLSDEAAKEVDISYKNCAVGLCYQTVKPGVLVLARVKYASETKVVVSLPGKMIGTIMACHISEQYNKLLEAYVNDKIDKVMELPSMFRVGQYIAVKVLEAEGDKLLLSAIPQHVNGAITHTDLHQGCLLQAAVASVEDHGYVMDIGVRGTRAFMPTKSANPEIKLEEGMVTWCMVKSVTPSTESSVVKLCAALEALQEALRRKRPRGTTVVLPGTLVDFTVHKPLDNGIEGTVFGETAYVQRYHAVAKGKKPAIGQRIRARILYTLPTRNTPFLTTMPIFETTYPDLETEQTLKTGAVIEDAQVMKITGRSIHFRLAKKCVGTLSMKRLQVDEDLADEQIVAKSYPIGSTHKVRVLSYNLSDYMYSITDQPAVVNEKYFSLEDLKVGDLVPATVKSVGDNNVMVTVGRVTGAVHLAHLSDTGIYVDPKKASTPKIQKKFKVGQKLTARVLLLDTDKQSLQLTLKPTLLAPDLVILSDYSQVEIGKAYTGVIKHIREYVLVSFFNNVVAYISPHNVTQDSTENINTVFHIGQIVSCTILWVDKENSKMSGSLTTPPFWPKAKPPNKRKIKEDSKSKDAKEGESKPKKKKLSVSEDDDDERSKKRKNKKKVEEDDVEIKDKKRKKDKKQELSEESDAIEADMYEDPETVLTEQDLYLTDLSDCTTTKQCKKRVVSLLKAIQARTKRLERIVKKIDAIEERGLNKHNQIYHRAMQSDKIVLEERMKKLFEVLREAQEKLIELGGQKNEDYKLKQAEKKKKKKETSESSNKEDDEAEHAEEIVNSEVIEESNLDRKKKDKTDKVDKKIKDKSNKVDKKVKEKSKEFKVVESMEPALEVPSAKDFWSVGAEALAKKVEEDEDSSSEDEQQELPRKKAKKLSVSEKLAKLREDEERVRAAEAAAAAAGGPNSIDQFERALLATPDDSRLWIAYMAFHLQATEIEKARAVCRKALNTISFRAEDERLNVWLALLNTEHRFGTKESQQKTLEEALQMNDTYQVHSKLLEILHDTGKTQELASLVDLMLRKYKRDPKMYIQCGAACFNAGLVDKARQVMQKAIAVLEKKEHVSVLVQFALLERSHGGRERAEALFEQIVTTYPQRVDVVAVYVDMLAKGGDYEQLRQVMERMTSQKLPARKMKILYRKWIEVEEKVGDEDRVETVRRRAMEYIDKATF